jgi:DNA-binding protein HU-beta
MNKAELVEKIAGLSELSKTDTTKALDSFIKVVGDTLASGGEIRLVGFGTFNVVERKASNGRNPKTGEPIQIAASKAPKFRSGKGLKDVVNKR